MKKNTQQEQVFRMWLDAQIQKPEQWFKGSDFIARDVFIGYKAPARFCELAKDYPEIIESRMNGRFREARIIFKDLYEKSQQLPSSLRNLILSRFMKTHV